MKYDQHIKYEYLISYICMHDYMVPAILANLDENPSSIFTRHLCFPSGHVKSSAFCFHLIYRAAIHGDSIKTSRTFHLSLCWLTTFYGSYFSHLCFTFIINPQMPFLRNMSRNVRSSIILPEEKPKQVFLSALCTLHQQKQWRKWFATKTFTHFPHALPHSVFFCWNVIQQWQVMAKKTKNKQKEKILTIIKYRS